VSGGGGLELEMLGDEDGVTLGTEASVGLSEGELLGFILGTVVEENFDGNMVSGTSKPLSVMRIWTK
jgi:hypothetical protein